MDAEGFKFIAIGLMAFAMLGASIGIGTIFSSVVSGIARNPATEKKLLVPALIGAAMAELMGLVAVAVTFILIYQ